MQRRVQAVVRASCRALALAALWIGVANAVPVWTSFGQVSNSTNPSVWTHHSVDVSSAFPGATSAVLSFDLRNDNNSPGLTTSRIELGIEDASYFARFFYVTGDDTSHWRDVRLDLDGVEYVDQYGASNDHLGDVNLGTVYEGAAEVVNILGATGEAARIYALQLAVPEPGAATLMALGLGGLIVVRRRAGPARPQPRSGPGHLRRA